MPKFYINLFKPSIRIWQMFLYNLMPALSGLSSASGTSANVYQTTTTQKTVIFMFGYRFFFDFFCFRCLNHFTKLRSVTSQTYFTFTVIKTGTWAYSCVFLAATTSEKHKNTAHCKWTATLYSESLRRVVKRQRKRCHKQEVSPQIVTSRVLITRQAVCRTTLKLQEELKEALNS